MFHFQIIAADWYFFKIDSFVISNLLKRKKSVTCTYLYAINVREYRRGNQKWTIQRNWQHRAHKTKINKAKTQQNICWTPPCVNKHKQRKRDIVLYWKLFLCIFFNTEKCSRIFFYRSIVFSSEVSGAGVSRVGQIFVLFWGRLTFC